MSTKPIVALDVDGVLLDYHLAYRHAWHRTFGVLPDLADPEAYWPIDRWAVSYLQRPEMDRLRADMDEEFWTTLPAIPGAISATLDLRAAGYELVCISALPLKFEAARLKNLRSLGFPIERVIATPANPESASVKSVKADALAALKPVAFVDDYAPYLRGIPADVHAALVLREPNGSPNIGDDLRLAHSQHADLATFAAWWLDPTKRGPTG
jgi:phosphoglycolate phosphatase-like HAD superfamily hydrolase